MASSKFKQCCGLLTLGCTIFAVVFSCLAAASCDFIVRDIRGDDGAVVTSATFGLFKSSLTGNTCVSSSEKDVEWLYGWARISSLLAPLFGAILVAAILVDRSCNACCMKATKIFLVLGSQLNQLFTSLLWLSDVCWLKTGDGWGDYEFKDCTMGNGSIFSATAFGLFFVGSFYLCCAPKPDRTLKADNSADSNKHGDVEDPPIVTDGPREDDYVPWWKFWARKQKSEEVIPDKKTAPDEDVAPAIASVKTAEEDVPSPTVAGVQYENKQQIEPDEPKEDTDVIEEPAKKKPWWKFWAQKEKSEEKSEEVVQDEKIVPDDEVAPDDAIVLVKSDDEEDLPTTDAVQSANEDIVEPDETREDTDVAEEPVKKKSWFSRKKKSEEGAPDEDGAPDEEVVPDEEAVPDVVVAPVIVPAIADDKEVPSAVAAVQCENDEKLDTDEPAKEKALPLKRFWSRKRTSDKGQKEVSDEEESPVSPVFTPPVVFTADGNEESGMEIEFDGEFGTSQRV